MAPDEGSDAVQACHPPPPPCRPRSWWAALRTCEGVATTRLCLVWDELLAQRGQLRSRERKAELPSERRGWAFDLPPGGGTTANAPKRWVAADVDAFIDVYMELGPLERHGRIRPQDPRGPPQDPRPEVTTRRSPQSREQPQDPRRRDTTRRSPSRERGRQKLRSNHRIPAHHHEIPAHQRSACGPTLALGCSRRPSVPQVPPMQRFDLGDLRLDRQGGAGSGSARPRRNSR